MKTANITILEGAPDIYPLWDKLTVDVINNENIKNFRKEKETEGYEIFSGNQLAKDGTIYWLIFDEEFNCSLQPYARMN